MVRITETAEEIFERTKVREIQLSRLLVFHILGGLRQQLPPMPQVRIGQSALQPSPCGSSPRQNGPPRPAEPTRGSRSSCAQPTFGWPLRVAWCLDCERGQSRRHLGRCTPRPHRMARFDDGVYDRPTRLAGVLTRPSETRYAQALRLSRFVGGCIPSLINLDYDSSCCVVSVLPLPRSRPACSVYLRY